MARETRRTTLREIAEDVGVSTMTVSNAFNRPDQLSAALRERILERARTRGYAGPDPLARGLRRGRAGAIGLVSDTSLAYAFEDPAASAVVGGLCAAVERDGLGVLVVPAGGAAALSSAVVDGSVVYSVADDDPLLALAARGGRPGVVIDQPVDTPLPRVGIDDRAAAEAVARHLAERGYRRVAIVSFSLTSDLRTGRVGETRPRSTYAVTRARLEGYAAALGPVPVWESAGSDRVAGRDAARVLLAGPERPTAILATSDVLALGVLDAASEAGLDVPGELAVAGFDDVPAAADAGLTTVRQDHRAKGRLAGELLLAALRGERVSSPPPLPHELVARASTAPPGA